MTNPNEIGSLVHLLVSSVSPLLTSILFVKKYKVSTPSFERYHLSMMLAYTGGNNNNTMDQITRYLRTGAKADGTNVDLAEYQYQQRD